ncbi:MAG: hypothetical protein ACP5JU_03205, partial [Minisyncoccia bacterium]
NDFINGWTTRENISVPESGSYALYSALYSEQGQVQNPVVSNPITVNIIAWVQKCYMGFGYLCPQGVNPPNPQCKRDSSYDKYCQAGIRE